MNKNLRKTFCCISNKIRSAVIVTIVIRRKCSGECKDMEIILATIIRRHLVSVIVSAAVLVMIMTTAVFDVTMSAAAAVAAA